MRNRRATRTGVLRKGPRTKDLVKRLQPGEVALIRHEDLDTVAAETLVRARVSAVVNASISMTGRYPNAGPRILLENNISLVELRDEADFGRFPEGQRVTVDLSAERLHLTSAPDQNWPVHVVEEKHLEQKLVEARKNLRDRLQEFVRNTLDYVSREDHMLLDPMAILPLQTVLTGRHALVVVRGEGYRQDLETILGYLHDVRPVMIGVDGGADALRELGLRPDIILGDMDSVSDATLRCGAEILVHGYPGRGAPGMERIRRLGLEDRAKVIEATGTSEDVALLLAYEKGASLIVAVGTHSSMVDFLDKGRGGMASTFLARLKVGNLLVDARGVRHLYGRGMRVSYLAPLLLVGLFAAVVIVLASPSVQSFLQLVGYRMIVFLRSLFGVRF